MPNGRRKLLTVVGNLSGRKEREREGGGGVSKKKKVFKEELVSM